MARDAARCVGRARQRLPAPAPLLAEGERMQVRISARARPAASHPGPLRDFDRDGPATLSAPVVIWGYKELSIIDGRGEAEASSRPSVSHVGAPSPSQRILCAFLVLQKAAREGALFTSAYLPPYSVQNALGPQTFKSPLGPCQSPFLTVWPLTSRVNSDVYSTS